MRSLDFEAKETPVSWSRRLQRVGQFAFVVALLAAILPYGAVTPVSLTLAYLASSGAAALGSLKPPEDSRIRRTYGLSLALVAFLTLYVLFQSWSFPGNPLGHPIWGAAQSLIGEIPSSISVAPGTSLSAILPLTMPFLIYCAGLCLFRSDSSAFGLFMILGVIGTLVAVFGLIQVAFLPQSLLFTEKVAYLDSLTSIFVNRNTVGTLLGLSSLACLVLLMRMVRQAAGPSALLRLLGDSGFSRGRRLRAWGISASILICILALFLSRSRGATLATAASFLLILPLLLQVQGSAQAENRRGEENEASRRRRMLKGIGLALLIVGGFIVLFGGQFLLRLETRGVDASRLCVYTATLRAISDNWLFGTGFGTFESVFPSYRTLGCGSPYESFDKAHNVFLEGFLGLGMVFVPITLIVYGQISAILVRGLKTRRRLRFVPVIAMGAVMLVTLHSLVDFSLQIPGMAAYFAAFLAASTTICLGRPSGVRRWRTDHRYAATG